MPSTVVHYGPGIHFVNRIYLDANFLAAARDRSSLKYLAASQLLADLLSSQKILFVSNLVIDELCWALLRAYYRRDYNRILSPQMVKRDPTIISQYHNGLASLIVSILSFQGLVVASDQVSPREIVEEAISLMGSELLMPRDSFHLAFITKLAIEGLVTEDRDFDNVNIPSRNLTIYKF